MSLKTATFIYTKENGEAVTRIASIKKVVFHYDEMAIETIYEMFPSAEAKAKGAIPELISQRVAVDLTDQNDLVLVLSASERIWEKNASAPFIADFSELDDDGKMIRQMKSLDELGAEIVEVQLG